MQLYNKLSSEERSKILDTLNQKRITLSFYQYAKIDDDYKYLIKMPMDSVTEENVAQIMKEKETTEKEIETLTKTRVQTL